MPGRRLKVFRAHLGFYDTVVAAPSQKAALEAWGAGAHEFSAGFAEVTSDPDAVTCASAHPGIVLKRPFGTKGPYKRDADPIRPPRATAKQRKSAAAAARKRQAEGAVERRQAERALRAAEREARQKLADIGQREAELQREKIAAREGIARAKSRLARQATR
jgi:colicin import membrane protein